MINKISNAKHAAANTDATGIAIDHRSLKSRATAAVVAGCLALTMVPGVALAAQPGDAGQQGDMPAMEQGAGRDFQAGTADRSGQPGGDFGSFGQDGAFEQTGNQDQGWQGEGGTEAPQGEAPDFGNGGTQGEMPDFGDGNGGPTGEAPDFGNGGQEGAPSGEMPAGDNEFGAMQFDGSGQQPNFGGPRDGGADDQIRQLLSDSYGVEAPSADSEGAGQPGEAPSMNSEEDGMPAYGMPGGFGGPGALGNPEDAPELPEGAVNMQKVIDSTRDVLKKFGAEFLSTADFSDESFATDLSTYVNEASEQRMEMFENGTAPDSAPQGDTANGSGAPQAPKAADGAAPDSNGAPAGAPADQNVDKSVLQQVVDFLMNLFGYNA